VIAVCDGTAEAVLPAGAFEIEWSFDRG
jgi:hypothetical protein